MCDAGWTFIVPLCLVCSTVGDIKVKSGGDAVLWCLGSRNTTIKLLEWTKPDLNPDSIVFYYRGQHIFENYQHPYYRGRVELKDPQLKNGSFSVIVKNVTLNDTGTYECQVGYGDKPELINSTTLTITDSDPHEDGGGRNTTSNTPVGLVVGLTTAVLLLMLLAAVLVMYRRRKRPQTPAFSQTY
ncbi:myelin protein P0-like [Betta splendens]|uniref:Myelin protein P0-like n=1 Tax=Betta splendens TaxID=158456 RepID=A0A6P7LW17_BETSP|nr:myelin protein P0-like [Betta splendens]